jgi:polyhydroxybutyrate depolymerase
MWKAGTALLVLVLGGCGFDPLDRCASAEPGTEVTCPMPGVLDRAFDLRVPASWDGRAPLPLVYAFHGGGGNRRAAAGVTCPDGDRDHPDCLTARATAAGYAIVLPDGTGSRPARNLRTWNAGGGVDGWQCVSGPACKSGVDDMAHLDAVHAEVERIIPVDATRVYATGLSNGAAISHRLACERPARFAAIAPVGGNNQHAVAGGACAGGVPLLQLHGTEDPCWGFTTTTRACAQDDGLKKQGVMESMEGWRERNGCEATTTETPLPDPADDGTQSTRVSWSGCSADTELIRIEGGGHTWPQGDPYFGEDTIGRVSQDFDGDDLILEFFGAHTR